MSEPTPQYLIRDPQGNVYGPADEAMLRQWVQQGRIVPGMEVALRETRAWIEASQHPAIADLLARPGAAAPAAEISAPPADGPVTNPAEPTASPTPAEPPSPTAAPSPQEPGPSAAPTTTPVTRQLPLTPLPGVSGTVKVRAAYPGQTLYPSSDLPRPNAPALIGFILGIIGLMGAICPCAQPLSAVFGVAAITLAGIGLYQIKLNPPRFTGSGLGIAGIAMGIVTLLIALGWLVVFVLRIRHP